MIAKRIAHRLRDIRAGRGYDLTLVESEILEELALAGYKLVPSIVRRNLVVRDIALYGLIGKRFRSGRSSVSASGAANRAPTSNGWPAPGCCAAWAIVEAYAPMCSLQPAERCEPEIS